MKRISFFLFAAVATAACTSSNAPDEEPSRNGSEVNAGNGDVDDRLACAEVGGECMSLSSSSCEGGTWADAETVSCGDGVGTGCCVKPQPPPPPPPPEATQCESKGGECVGVSPSSCEHGVFADASTHSCGASSSVGVGCCVTCPVLSPPAPGFCPDGEIQPRKDEAGCVRGYDCVPPQSK